MRLLMLLLGASISFAALPSREVSKGNKAAQSGQTDQAQYHYVKALENKADTSTVMYDLGNALYDAGEFERAMKVYMGAIDSTRSPKQLDHVFYNIGNAGLQAQKFDEAISAYIEALRHDPDDQDAKHNLELAMRMKQQSEQEQQEQEQNQDQNQEKSEDQQQNQENQDQKQQDQQQEQGEQDQQHQDQPQQDQPQNQDSTEQQQAQPQPQQMTKEEAEHLLNALLQDEQNTLEQVRKAKVAQRKKRVKDW